MSVELLKQYWDVYAVHANALGQQILDLANPDAVNHTLITKDWLLCDFASALALAGGYLSFVLISAAFKTQARPDADPKTSVLKRFRDEPILLVQAVYNLVQVLLCGYMMVEAVRLAYEYNFSVFCNTHNYARDGIAAVHWIFYVSKVLDFMDTFFMIVRGKWRQVSFLHVYHHTSIFLIYWININVAYDGDIYYTIVLNAFVHFVMYGYYLLRTFNIHVPQIVKMFVTNIQRIQFCAMLTQGSVLLYKGCEYPPRVTIGYLFYITSMLYLFTSFYNSSYKKAAVTKKEKKQE